MQRSIIARRRNLELIVSDIARRIGGKYVTYRHATITSIARTSTTSVAYFVTVVPAGTHLRAFLPKSQVGSDYLDGHSNFVVQ